MSSWQVLQVSAPQYREGSDGRTYFCACSSLAFVLGGSSRRLPELSSAAALAANTSARTIGSARNVDTRPRKRNMEGSPSPIQLSTASDRAPLWKSSNACVRDASYTSM